MRCRALIKIVLVGCLTAPSLVAGDLLIVGYYPDWSKSSFPPASLEYENITHLVHAFIAPNSNGTLAVGNGFVTPSLIQTAHEHGVKVIISLGGWGNCAGFSPLCADSSARSTFVDGLTTFCTTNGYDGADLDWEYPANASDRSNLTRLVRELRAAFSPNDLSLSITVPSTSWSGQWFDVGAMKDDLDWIGIMTYDYFGSWTANAGPNSALYGSFATNTEGWIDYSFGYYAATRGVPAAKLLIGVPFYGWSYNASAMYGASTGASQLAYTSIVPKIAQGWTRYWDNTGQVPYLINPAATTVISYDDSASVALKGSYVRSKGAGGAIIWALGQDNVGGRQVLLESFAAAARQPQVVRGLKDNPAEFEVDQNYPNPFNGETRIRYVLPHAGWVTLRMYDIVGRIVSTVVDGNEEAGLHVSDVSVPDLASGVYVYRLTWQGFSLARTMIVLR